MSAATNKLSVRVVAVHVLLRVIRQHQSLGRALTAGQQLLKNRSDSALLQEICYGSLRWYYRLQYIAAMLLNKPLKQRDQDVHCLIVTGLYQLAFMHVPAHAVVKETVDAVQGLNKPWARALVNAVLRGFQRRNDELRQQWQQDEQARFAHPAWMIARLRQDWPQQYQAVLDANNERPPMVLRVDLQQTRVEDYQERLQQAGIGSRSLPLVETALLLEQAQNVHDLPDFDRGVVSVQDAAAQLAAGLMQLQPGMRVLDACCAPGGKTLHMLQSGFSLSRLLALDVDAERLQQVRENLGRASLSAELCVGDAARPADWWDGQSFQRMLVDAPCTGSGVIRRHPDIKLLREYRDIEQLAGRQAAILDALWPLLAPGGMLVYSTCSVFRQENEDQIDAFLQRTGDACERRISADWGIECKAGRQILPGAHGTDGFYYACLEKITDKTMGNDCE